MDQDETRAAALDRLSTIDSKQRVLEYVKKQTPSAFSLTNNNNTLFGEAVISAPNAQEPENNVNVLRPIISSPVQSINNDTIEFLARRELISKKIEKFDDRPENFNAWKGSFENMMPG